LLTLLFIAFVAADNLQVAKDLVAFLRAHKNDTKAQDRAWEKANKIFAQTSDCMVFWEGLCPNPSGNGCGFYSTRVDFDRDYEKGDAWLYISQSSQGWQLFSDGVKQACGSGPESGALYSPLSKARYVANDGDTTGTYGPRYWCAQGFITLNYNYDRGQLCTGQDTCYQSGTTKQGCGSIAYSAVWADPTGHYDSSSKSNPQIHNSICYVTGGNTYSGAGFTSTGSINTAKDVNGNGYACAGSAPTGPTVFYGGNHNTPQNQFPNDCCVENELITGTICVAPNAAPAL